MVEKRKVRRTREELRKVLGPAATGELVPIPPAPVGYVYRLIRISIRGEDDLENVRMRQRQGWTFVQVSELPKEWQVHFSSRSVLGTSDVACVGDRILGKMPEERAQAFKELTELAAAEQMDAVNRQLLSAPGQNVMPTFNESETQVKRGRYATKFD